MPYMACNSDMYLNGLISASCFCWGLTCGLFASASLHCRRNSLRFPQAMNGNSTMGFSPSSVHTWLMGNRFLKVKRKTSWGTGTVCNGASILYMCAARQTDSWKRKYMLAGVIQTRTVEEEVSAKRHERGRSTTWQQSFPHEEYSTVYKSKPPDTFGAEFV